MKLEIILPFPPTVNTYWRSRIVHCKNKPDYVSVYISEQGVKFKQDVIYEVMKQKIFNKRLSGRLKVTVHLYPPSKIKMDLDNRMKSLLDALGFNKDGEGARVYLDDSQIDILNIERKAIEKPGKAIVFIETIENSIFTEVYKTKIRK